jgi:hypothetical protein
VGSGFALYFVIFARDISVAWRVYGISSFMFSFLAESYKFFQHFKLQLGPNISLMLFPLTAPADWYAIRIWHVVWARDAVRQWCYE